jgi:aminoglycoside phosphotransferase
MTDTPAALGTGFQWFDFIVREIAGSTVERLLVWFGHEPVLIDDAQHGALRQTAYTAAGAIVFLKPRGRRWQRFFVDAGLANLDEHEEAEVLDELDYLPDDGVLADLGARHQLIGATIELLVAGIRSDVTGTGITLRLTDGRELLLLQSDPTVLDSPAIVAVRHGAWPAPRFELPSDPYDKAGQPTTRMAAEVALEQRGDAPVSAARFPLGLAHWVYDVSFITGPNLVVRMTMPEHRAAFEGAVHWSSVLRPLGVPLPVLLAHGEHQGFPFLVLERLQGKDLGMVYPQLGSSERAHLARELSRLQCLVATLPEAPGFGSVASPAGPYHPSWSAFISELIAMSRQRIETTRVVATDVAQRVEDVARQLESYFASVRPTAFLDDATTKNVLVHEGRLSGIVDVDELGFGDSLLTIGLTRASLLANHSDCEYADLWLEHSSPTPEQRSALSFYTALYGLVFISEQGERFNRPAARIDSALLARLEQLVDEPLKVVATFSYP